MNHECYWEQPETHKPNLLGVCRCGEELYRVES